VQQKKKKIPYVEDSLLVHVDISIIMLKLFEYNGSSNWNPSKLKTQTDEKNYTKLKYYWICYNACYKNRLDHMTFFY